MSKDIKTNKPAYDSFFKFNLTQPDIAERFIRQHFDPEVTKVCDFSQMKPEPHEYIDEELKKLITDVTWSLPINGSKGYVYTLIEHESGIKDHKLLPFRLHKYMLRIMENHLKQDHDYLVIDDIVLNNTDYRDRQ